LWRAWLRLKRAEKKLTEAERRLDPPLDPDETDWLKARAFFPGREKMV